MTASDGGLPVWGPYTDERNALDHPACRTADALHLDYRIPSREIGTMHRDLLTREALAVLDRFGVAVGDYDRRALRWLAGMETADTGVVLGLVSRAYAAGEAAARASIAAELEGARETAKAHHYIAALTRAITIARGGKRK